MSASPCGMSHRHSKSPTKALVKILSCAKGKSTCLAVLDGIGKSTRRELAFLT